MRTPLVSVVIPTHNRAPLLKLAIDSVLAQTWAHMEVLVVDDNSSDGTETMIQEFDDPRIQYMRHSADKGAAAARNTGIKAALGSYIAFLDDDDEWEENKLEKQLMTVDDYDVILCGARLKTGKVIQRYKKETISPRDLKRGFLFGGGTSAILAKSDPLKNTLFDEELTRYQDWDLLIRLASKYKIRYMSEPLLIFNAGAHDRISNAHANMPISQLEKEMRAIEKHRDFLGPFWFNYHTAKLLLAYLKLRQRPIGHIVYTIERCGLAPVVLVYLHRLS